MKTQTRQTQARITPQNALDMLKEGNRRFLTQDPLPRGLLTQVKDTESGQFPFAVILGCIDSRVPPELIFDQGIGDIFSVRIAGNVISGDVLGSLEFACRGAGARLILIMGHTACGAVKGAADAVRMGHLTGLVQKIQPALDAISAPADPALRDSRNLSFINQAARQNVLLSLDALRTQSPLLNQMEQNQSIRIVGSMYDVSDGSVEFYE